MPSEISIFIIHHGYLAIFLLVMLQGIGVPVPVPVEFVVMFCGYLVGIDLLKLPMALVTVISADFIGSAIVYFIFYLFGSWILRNKPKWLPFSDKTINNLHERVSKGGTRTLYIVRFTPFIRGYVCLVAGLTQISTRIFLPIVLVTAILWSAAYLSMGWLLAPYWTKVESHLKDVKFILLAVMVTILSMILYRYFRRKKDIV